MILRVDDAMAGRRSDRAATSLWIIQCVAGVCTFGWYLAPRFCGL
jgi:hypothetical protein